MSHACRCELQKEKKNILESKRRARENEVLEEGKKHKLGEVFQKKKKCLEIQPQELPY